jgi:phosphoribosylformylglycinamidine synthase subunit PurS
LITAEIYITLKPGVLDPQGTTLRRSMETIGYAGLEDVRMGKFIQVKFSGDDRAKAEADVQRMCQSILANPVIEQFRYRLTEE